MKLPFIGRREVEMVQEPTNPDAPLLEKDWIGEFNLAVPRERAIAWDVLRMEDSPFNAKHHFHVVKSIVGPRSKMVPTDCGVISDTFITADMCADLVEENWGGGQYQIRHTSAPQRVLKVYTIPGASKTPKKPEDDKPKNTNGTSTNGTGDMADLEALEKVDPDAAREMRLSIMAKKHGIPIPKAKPKVAGNLNEELLRERMEADPNFKNQFTDVILEEKRAEIEAKKRKKEPTFQDRMDELDAFADRMGYKRPGDLPVEPEKEGMGTAVVKGLFDVMKNPDAIQGIAAGVATLLAKRADSQPNQPNPAAQPQLPAPGSTGAQPTPTPTLTPVRPPTPPRTIPGVPEPVVNRQPPPAPVAPTPSSSSSPHPAPATDLGFDLKESMVLPPSAQSLSLETWVTIIKNSDIDQLIGELRKPEAPGPDNKPMHPAIPFIRDLYDSILQNNETDVVDIGVNEIVRLIRDHDPVDLHRKINSDYLPKIAKGGQYHGLAGITLGNDKRDKAITLLQELASNSGFQWLQVAHSTCIWYEKRTMEVAAKLQQEQGALGTGSEDAEENAQMVDRDTTDPRTLQSHSRSQSQSITPDGTGTDDGEPLL